MHVTAASGCACDGGQRLNHVSSCQFAPASFPAFSRLVCFVEFALYAELMCFYAHQPLACMCVQINALSTFFVGLAIAFWKGWQLTLVLFGFVPILGIAALFLVVSCRPTVLPPMVSYQCPCFDYDTASPVDVGQSYSVCFRPVAYTNRCIRLHRDILPSHLSLPKTPMRKQVTWRQKLWGLSASSLLSEVISSSLMYLSFEQ